ncbi:hypothetical protein BGW38_005025, partial [Lunasporangiospora selenospora]
MNPPTRSKSLVLSSCKAPLELSPSSTQPSTAISSDRGAWSPGIPNPEEIEQYRAELSISAYRSLLNTQLKSGSSSSNSSQNSGSSTSTGASSLSTSTSSVLSANSSPLPNPPHGSSLSMKTTSSPLGQAHHQTSAASLSVKVQEHPKNLQRDDSWHLFKSSMSTHSMSTTTNPELPGNEESLDQNLRAPIHIKRSSFGHAGASKLRLSPVNIKLNTTDHQQYSPSLSSDSSSPSPSSGSPLMSSASSISSPHSNISWKARLRRSLSNQEKIQSPLSNVFNPDMTPSDGGDPKSSTESLTLETTGGFVISREKSYDMDPDSNAGSGDDEEYLGGQSRTGALLPRQRTQEARGRTSVDGTGSRGLLSLSLDSSSEPTAEAAATTTDSSRYLIPIVQPQSPRSEPSTGITLSAPTRTSLSSTQHPYHNQQHLSAFPQSHSENKQSRDQQRHLNVSADSQKSSLDDQDMSPPTSPVAAVDASSPYSLSEPTPPSEILTARRSSSIASSPSSYQRHHSVYVLSGQMFKNSPQGSPKSRLARVLASDNEHYYTTDSDSDCWGRKSDQRKTSQDRVFSDSDVEDDGRQRHGPFRGFHFQTRAGIRVEYDSDHTTSTSNGQGSSRLDKLMSSPSLSAFGSTAGMPSNPLPAFFPDLSANAPQNLVSQIGFMDDTNELNATKALIHEMIRAKTKSDTEIRIILDGWYECKRDKDIAFISFQHETLDMGGSNQYSEGHTSTELDGWSPMDDTHRLLSLQSFAQPSDHWYESGIGPLDSIPTAKRTKRVSATPSRSSSISQKDSLPIWDPTSSGVTSIEEKNASHRVEELLQEESSKEDYPVVAISTPPIDIPSAENEEPNLRSISRKQSIMSRRIIASNSWPPTILASSHTTLLISIECISQQILHTPVSSIIVHPLKAVDIMKSLQTLMDKQRRMAVGNAEAEDLLTKLVYVFAPVCRLAERMHEHQQQQQQQFLQEEQIEPSPGHMQLLYHDQASPYSYLDWSPLPSPAIPARDMDEEKSRSTTSSSVLPETRSHIRSATESSVISSEPLDTSLIHGSPEQTPTNSRTSLEQHLAIKGEAFSPSQCVVASHAGAFSAGEIQLQSASTGSSLSP